MVSPSARPLGLTGPIGTIRPTALAAGLCLAFATFTAFAQQPAQAIDLPAAPLDSALNALARQAGIQILFAAPLTDGKHAPALRGEYDAQQALEHLLAGSGLVLQRADARTFRIEAAARQNAAALAEIRVSARRAGDGTTEDAHAYTSRVTAIASKTDMAFREIPQSVSVVTRELLDDRKLLNVSDALQAMPGVTTRRLNQDSFNFYSRGFQITSMQIDGGAPLALGAYTYSANQDMAFYDRVEVMRGASGLLGGHGDPGGVINLARKKPLATPTVTIEQSAGRWDRYRSLVDASGALTREGTVRGRAVLVYDKQGSYLDDRSTEKPAVYGVLEADLTPDTLLTVGGSYARSHLNGTGDGLPRHSDGRALDVARSTNLTQPWTYVDTDSQEVFAQLAHRFANDWQLKLNLTRSEDDSAVRTALAWGAVFPDGSGPTWGGGRYAYENRQDLADLSLAGTFGLLGRRHELLLGLDWQRVQSAWHAAYSNDRWTVPVDVFERNAWNPNQNVPFSSRYAPWGQKQTGAYGVLRLHPTDTLHVVVGARVSRYDFEQTASSLDASGQWQAYSSTPFQLSTKTTPYGGLIYDFADQWSAYISYAGIYKPQSLMKYGPPPDGGSLAPVKGKAYEAGVKGELLDGRLNATFSLFNVERTGTAVLDGRYPSQRDPWAGNCCYLPQGKVTSRGVDIELGGEVRPGWQLTAGYTFNTSKDRSTDTTYSSITPKHLLKLSTAYTLPGAWSRWKIGASTHVQSRHTVASSVYDSAGNAAAYTFRQGGYAILNAMVQYQPDPHWTLSLNVDNLADRIYYERLGDADGGNWYGTPRNATLTARYRF